MACLLHSGFSPGNLEYEGEIPTVHGVSLFEITAPLLIIKEELFFLTSKSSAFRARYHILKTPWPHSILAAYG